MSHETILIALPNDNLGGAEQFLKNIASHLSYKYEFVIVIFLKKKVFNGWQGLPKNVMLYYSNSETEKGGIFFLIKSIILISNNHKIIYTFSSHTHINGMLGLLRGLRLFKTKKLIVRESTTILTRFTGAKLFLFKIHYWLFYWFNDLVICQTEKMKNELFHYIPLSKKWNVKVFQNPIDLIKINKLKDEIIDSSFQINTIIAAGRLIKLKGFDVLIKAFAELLNKKYDFNLIILGEGEERQNLEYLISQLNLTKKIQLLGHVNNPIPYFLSAQICVVSSLVEGFPNVLLQMMSQCNKVVSTTCAGGIENIAGLFTCEPGDVNGLVVKIEDAVNYTEVLETRSKYDSFLKNNTIEKYLKRVFDSFE